MKIDYLKINGFGKLINKEIKLEKNINIIYGKNEAGKSTLLNFINSMFYGASKIKNGKEISDYDKYKPWKAEEFSGKLKYTLDNGEKYEVYRDFKSKNPIIYDNQKQDISNQFVIDKSKGIDYIYEQIGVDQDTFENTVITPQTEIAIGKNGQNIIIQKISNLVSSGDENVSFKKTLEKINKAQNEQVGTDRTTQKPMNNINVKIANLEYEKKQLEEYKILLSESSNNFDGTQKSIIIEEKRLELFRDVKDCLEKLDRQMTELDINSKIKNDYDNKIDILENKIDIKAKINVKNQKKNFLLNYIFILISLIILIIGIVSKLSIVFSIIFIILFISIGIITVLKKNQFKKEKNKKIKELEELEKKIHQEIEILEKNKKELDEKFKEKDIKLKEQKNQIDHEIISKYENELDIDFIEMVLLMNIDELIVSISNKEERINNLKFELKTKESYRNQIKEKIDTFSKIEEKLESAIQEKEELMSLNNSFNIAKDCMESAYEQIRENLSPVFTNELCNIVKNISDNKYSNIVFNDTEGLTVEIDDGRYMPVQRLSMGTVDQMYLALRISSINAISSENLPIILDESFVYFDDIRLKNILRFLNDNYKEKQIILFSCSNREKKALKELDIHYNEIVLES